MPLYLDEQSLNALYEQAFPGLRYITFVNGRTRAEIIPELEVRLLSAFSVLFPFLALPLHILTLCHATQGLLLLSLPPPSPSVGEPKLGELREKLRINPTGSGPWRAELKRGIEDMWKIAHSRVDKW